MLWKSGVSEVYVEKKGKASMNSVAPRFDELDLRRRELGLSYSILAELSGVSKPAIQRILTGKVPAPALTSVAAVAQALGMGGLRFLEDGSIKFDPSTNAQSLREQQAWKKARKLVGLVQDTSVLGSQAVNEADYQAMVERMYHQLLAGSSRRLWSC
jgi:transcriptional regulator with XRE-family HTH domain